MVADGAWRLRTVPGMLPARADQLPRLPFVLVSPQLPRKVRGFSDAGVQTELRRLVEEHLGKRLPIDLTRVYVTGVSLGGFGVWSFAARHADFFAAAAPICGGLPPVVDAVALRALLSVPLWVFHGANDSVIPVSQSDEAMRRLWQCYGEEAEGVGRESISGGGKGEVEKVENGGDCSGSGSGSGLRSEGSVARGGGNYAEKCSRHVTRGPRTLRYTRYTESPTPKGCTHMKGHAAWVQAYGGPALFEWMLSFSKA
jgi:predicted peptidase